MSNKIDNKIDKIQKNKKMIGLKRIKKMSK